MRAKLLLPLLLLGACSRDDIDPMKVQPRLRAYGPAEFFPERRAMQTPPEGTIPREAPIGDPARTTGLDEGKPVVSYPIPVTRELLARGRKRYDIACTPCHGIVGDGRGPVATKMGLRMPPSLHVRPIVTGTVKSDAEPVALAPGAAFRIITEGYGLMPSYEAMMPPDERWAVVAYVQALQRSQHVAAADLPESERKRLEEAR